MEVDFNGLRRNMLYSFNELIDLIKESLNRNSTDTKLINREDLDEKIRSLRNDIVWIAGVKMGDKIPSILHDDDFELKSWSVDDE